MGNQIIEFKCFSKPNDIVNNQLFNLNNLYALNNSDKYLEICS